MTNRNSDHWITERKKRNEICSIIGCGTEVKRVILDRGHKNGAEIHVISSTGIVTIYNERTGKMVTKLVARPGQIKRYWKDGKAPAELIKIAREHQRKGYNKIQEGEKK